MIDFLITYKTKITKVVVSVAFIICCLSCQEDDTVICPDLSFVTVPVNDDGDAYTFIANFENRENDIYAWYLDGDPALVAFGVNGILITIDGNTFKVDNLSAGDHEICIKTRKTGYCPDGEELCETITVPVKEDCESLNFSIDLVSGTSDTYEFLADFEAKDSIDYAWYINDQLFEKELVNDPNRDHKFIAKFPESGTYNVCMRSLGPSCPLSSTYCQGVLVDRFALCPNFELYRDEILESNTNLYKVTAVFLDEVTGDYVWEVNDQIIPNESIINVNNKEFTITLNLETGDNVFRFFPRNEGCPEEAAVFHTITVP